MRVELLCMWLVGYGCAFSQHIPNASKPDSAIPSALLDPNPLKWLSRIDGGKQESERLLNLTKSEFATAVEYLERGQDGMVSIRFVWLVAGNLKRAHGTMPAGLADRAAAALVKAKDIEDKNLRLQNLSNLGGVNHPLVRDMNRRLASSEDNYTALMAKRNLEMLKELENQPIKPAANSQNEASSKHGVVSDGEDNGKALPVTPAKTGEPLVDSPASGAENRTSIESGDVSQHK